MLTDKKFSDNKITSEKTLIKIFNNYKHLKDFKDLILLQPTSPMRTSHDIKKMYKIYRNKKIKSLISVIKVQKKKMIKILFLKKKNFIKPMD